MNAVFQLEANSCRKLVKDLGCALRKILKNTLKGSRISFDGRGSNGFSPLRGTNSKTTHVIFCHIFRLNTLKGAAIIIVAILDFSTLSSTNLAYI